MDWNTILADADSVCLSTFGESVTYRRVGSADVVISAIPADPLIEDNVAGQFTVRRVRRADVSGEPRTGDVLLIGSVVYDIFAVRGPEHDPLVRLYLQKQ